METRQEQLEELQKNFENRVGANRNSAGSSAGDVGVN